MCSGFCWERMFFLQISRPAPDIRGDGDIMGNVEPVKQMLSSPSRPVYIMSLFSAPTDR